jgi:hypothetical protein
LYLVLNPNKILILKNNNLNSNKLISSDLQEKNSSLNYNLHLMEHSYNFVYCHLDIEKSVIDYVYDNNEFLDLNKHQHNNFYTEIPNYFTTKWTLENE